VTLIDPGDRKRGRALAEEGRRTVVLLFGVALTLAVAGAIEGFVTGSGLPTVVRVGLGVAVEIVFFAWVGLLGPRAAAAGYTGRLGELPVPASGGDADGPGRSDGFDQPPVPAESPITGVSGRSQDGAQVP
jgi:hypothetical protein